jgi:alpha-D-xyloside xylohydrolase
LTIGERKGQFPGMLENRSFRVVFVRENHGVGVNATDEPDKVVQYSGKQISVSR